MKYTVYGEGNETNRLSLCGPATASSSSHGLLLLEKRTQKIGTPYTVIIS
jgi:hypothetical protein